VLEDTFGVRKPEQSVMQSSPAHGFKFAHLSFVLPCLLLTANCNDCEETANGECAAEADTQPPASDQVEAAPSLKCSGKNTSLKGTVAKDTTWKAGSLCILTGTVTVAKGATLTIQEGVTIKSGQAGKLGKRPLKVLGTLEVYGTAEAPVVFTDVRDDARRGDTNDDRDAEQPTRGSWAGIAFEPGARGLMQFAEVHYAEVGIQTTDAAPVLANISVTESNQALSSLATDELQLIGITTTNNGLNGVVRRGGAIAKDTVWDQRGAVHIFGGEITVEPQATLTVGPGVLIKSGNMGGNPGQFPLLVQGGLDVLGQEDLPVVFTDVRDDKAGDQDATSDADASAPTRGGCRDGRKRRISARCRPWWFQGCRT
jgi:hypothetical protein